MVIKPKIRGFICTTAHPVGCETAVKEQIAYVEQHGEISDGPKNVLILGCSTGYGLASRIVTAFGAGAKTLGVAYEREAGSGRTASAGWYNSVSFEKFAHAKGLYAKTLNGDAFSDEIKQQVVDQIKQDLGQIDLVIYSLASPRRTDPRTGETHNSTLKPIGEEFSSRTLDPIRGEVKDVTIAPAVDGDIENTIKVMGGEDWEMWIDLLMQENLLAPGAMTTAYTYIGPDMTHAVYKNGTIGAAKIHLHETAKKLDAKLQPLSGSAFLAVNKALVTQASAAIPVVPLYISILYKIMKAKGTHEGCIEQMQRLFNGRVFNSEHKPVIDGDYLIRMDDWEMAADIQQEVAELWPEITTENLEALTDIQGYRDDFYRLFGFNFAAVDYEADVAI